MVVAQFKSMDGVQNRLFQASGAGFSVDELHNASGGVILGFNAYKIVLKLSGSGGKQMQTMLSLHVVLYGAGT